MPRKPRLFSSSGIYHVVLRSVNQQLIFQEEADYLKFLVVLSECKSNFDVDIYAYCLMDNHVHLLLYSANKNLAGFFQSLGSRFVPWYNTKYSRIGYLFQGRFHSFAVENEPYYLSALTYIHNNPVKAGICKCPSEYRWSSYRAFYGKKDPLVNVGFSCSVAGSLDALCSYFNEQNGDDEWESIEEEATNTEHVITDEQALAVFKTFTKDLSIFDVASLPRSERNALLCTLKRNGLSYRQLTRLTGISCSTIYRVTHHDK